MQNDFELLAIRCLLQLIEIVGNKALNNIEDELMAYERNSKQQKLFEDSH